MDNQKPKKVPITFWIALRDAIKTALDEFNYRSDKETTFQYGTNNEVIVHWGPYVFVADLLDGVYAGATDLDDFGYYHHTNVPTSTDEDANVEVVTAPVNADWYNIRVIDALIDRAKKFAYIDMIAAYVDKDIPTFLSPDNLGISRNGLVLIKSLYEDTFTKILGIDREADSDNYSINVYPDYDGNPAVLIHTQLAEFDDKGYVNKDNSEFFLQWNLVSGEVNITPDLPWIISPDFNSTLFTHMPSNPDTEKSLLSAIRIAMNDVMFKAIKNYKQEDFFAPIDKSGLQTPNDTVDRFIAKFEHRLKLTADGTNEALAKGKNMTVNILECGLTVIKINDLTVEVAIDGIGLVDVYAHRLFTENDTWNDILWSENAVGNPKTTLRFEDVASDLATTAVLKEICDCVQGTMASM